MLPELACVKEWGAQLESQAVTQFPIRTATKLSGSQHSRQNSSSWFYYHREFLFIFFWLCCLCWRCVTTTKSVWHAMDVGLTQINAGKVQTAAAKLYGKPSTTPTKTKMKSRLRKMYETISDNGSSLATCLRTAFIHWVEWLNHSFHDSPLLPFWFILVRSVLAFVALAYLFDLFAPTSYSCFIYSIILESSYSLYDRAFADNIGTVLFYAVIVSLCSFSFSFLL